MLFNECLGRVAMRAVAGLVAAGALATLASCGGGTYQASTFVPARVLTFGDESSRLEGTQGLKYSINGISDATLQLDCTQYPIWTQILAGQYGLVYANCNPNASPTPNAIDLTKVDGTVGDVVKQVEAFQAGDTFNGNDLVTIWVGMHDVLSEYQANGTGDAQVLKDDMTAQGATLARTVNAITATGAKVVLLTIPNMSYTPFAYTESLRGDFDRLKLLSEMSVAFNLALRTGIINDGSKIALVLVDDLVSDATRNPSRHGLISNDNQVFGCLVTAPLPTCTRDTLRTDPATGQQATAAFMWADATHLGNVLQTELGNQAYGRAHGNPF